MSTLKITTKFSEIFEQISENTEHQLIGGFSASLSSTILSGVDESGPSNNCAGGNCVSGCGTGSNVSCNTVAGCGT